MGLNLQPSVVSVSTKQPHPNSTPNSGPTSTVNEDSPTLSKELSQVHISAGGTTPVWTNGRSLLDTMPVSVTRQALAAAAEAAALAAQTLLKAEPGDGMTPPMRSLNESQSQPLQGSGQLADRINQSGPSQTVSDGLFHAGASDVSPLLLPGGQSRGHSLLARPAQTSTEIVEELESVRENSRAQITISQISATADRHSLEVEEEPLAHQDPLPARGLNHLPTTAGGGLSVSAADDHDNPITEGLPPSCSDPCLSHDHSLIHDSRDPDLGGGIMSLASLSSLRPVTGNAYEGDFDRETSAGDRLDAKIGADSLQMRNGLMSVLRSEIAEKINGQGSDQLTASQTWSDSKNEADLFDELYEEEIEEVSASREDGKTGGATPARIAAGGGGGGGDADESIYRSPYTTSTITNQAYAPHYSISNQRSHSSTASGGYPSTANGAIPTNPTPHSGSYSLYAPVTMNPNGYYRRQPVGHR